ncbi:reverse transcriptase [Gossypium australe]|uniref:Reverse transcriptase n=1 Tax=Gossypium australe TaxID=47621 RepID=A0A5B6VUL9_9ROSI|nr:reverse transcriptase [Gossypium australe]
MFLSKRQVLWNGVPTNKFRPLRGISQGCPLSPYLFLGHSINSSLSKGIWKPIRLSRLGPALLHLFFVDDLVDDLGRYLGIPLFHKRVTNSTLHFVIEKVRMKLQSWDARRVILVQSVLLVIPSYFMQSMMIPRQICDKIECLVRRFIWGTSDGKKKMSLAWLPEEIIPHIMGIPPLHPAEGSDRLSWRHTSTGAFSVKSAYKALKEVSWNSRDELWKRAWKILGPQRRLLTNVERVRRGLAVDASCLICGHASENILHIIRDCTVAKEVWKQDTSLLHGGEISWACIFGLLAWRLWKNRNLSIFQRKSWSSSEIIKVSMYWAKHATLESRNGLSDNIFHSMGSLHPRIGFFLMPMVLYQEHQDKQLLEEWYGIVLAIG